MKQKNYYLVTILLLLFTFQQAKSQLNNTATVRLDLLGESGLAGVTFDQRFSENYKGWGYRAGIGMGFANAPWTFVPFNYAGFVSFPKQQMMALPLQINYLLGNGNNQLDVGAGVTPFYSNVKFNDKSNLNAFGTISAGYRYHNLNNNLMFGAGLMFGYKLPGLKINNIGDVIWHPYLSIGYIIN